MQREIKLEKVFAKKRTNGLRYVMIKMHGIMCYIPVKKSLKIQKQMLLKLSLIQIILLFGRQITN